MIAIPNGELSTARRLYECLLDLPPDLKPSLHVRHYKIDTLAALKEAISALEADTNASGLLPWIHIEGHGSRKEDGFETANGEFCHWEALKELVIPLNIAAKLNVIVILATCFGGSFTSTITTTDRAPVLGLIGPVRDIKAGEVEIDFPAFYKTFLSTNSIKQSLEALTARTEEKLYFATNAQEFFYAVWHSYKRILCTPEMLGNRALEMQRKLTDAGMPAVPSVGELEKILKSQEQPQFESFCETYFMYDLYPENRERFQVTYERAESESAR